MRKEKWAAVLIILMFLFSGTGFAEKLDLKEISRIGKAATALVEVNSGKSSGTAFCIQESGIFLTNAHVVRNVKKGKTVRLVVEPGEEGQKIFQAVVIMRDEKADLAVLKTNEKADLEPLKLGTSKDLFEMMQICAFGFPFGKSLSFDKGEFPAISINIGRVTSLRKKQGVLERIQIDADLNPGNSGGPVLDESGRVVGIVESGVSGTNVNFAIPVASIRKFLSGVMIFFEAPAIDTENLDKPVKFEARIVDCLQSGDTPLEVELTLESRGNPKIQKKMTDSGKAFSAEVIIAPKREGPAGLSASVEYKDGSIKGTLEPVVFKVGEEEIPLDKVCEIRGGTKPEIVLRSDSEKREIAADTKLVIVAGPHRMDIDLSSVEKITIEKPSSDVLREISYVIVARRGTREVGRLAGIISVSAAGARLAGPASSTPVVLKPSEFEGDKVVKKCPAAMSDIIDAAGGKYLICHFPKLRKLGIFDVEALKFVKYISVNDQNVKFAAGREKLIVALSNHRVIQRWNLKTFEKEVTVAIPFNGNIREMCMGSDSDGPLYVHSSNRIPESQSNLGLMDISKMRMMDVKVSRCDMPMRVSADGTVLAINNGTLVAEGDRMKFYGGDGSGLGIPSADGKFIFSRGSVFNTEMRRVYSGSNETFIPARHGDYYLGLFRSGSRSGSNSAIKVKVYLARDNRGLVTLSDIDITSDYFNTRSGFTVDKRIWCFPLAKVLITIPLNNDRFVIYRFDPEAALEKSGIDYLLVTSKAPSAVTAGNAFRYDIKVKSKRGGVKFTLESGPEGMSLSESGGITWTIPADIEDEKVFIIVCISDSSGQEIYHNFDLKIIKP